MFYDYPILRPLQVAEDNDSSSKAPHSQSSLPPLSLPAFLQDSPSRSEVIRLLMDDGEVYNSFLSFPAHLQEEFLDFCSGQKGVKLTYDPFFKYIFNPELHPERLERFLSSVIGEPVKIRQALPLESLRLHEGMSFVIMDILVELQSGSLCNVEIQKSPYDFPGQRAACYSSELVIRQYSRVRQRMREQGLPFSYQSLSRVYTIVLLEKSEGEFLRYSDHYIHRSAQVFDTGLSLNLLQEYVFISLDIFRNIVHNITKELDAWLLFLSSDRPADIARIIYAFPEFAEYYRDLVNFRHNPKELVHMFSSLLAELDRDEFISMMERTRKSLKEQEQKIESLKREAQLLTKKTESLTSLEQSLKNRNQSLINQNQSLANQNQSLTDQNQSLTDQNQSLTDQNQSLTDQNQSLTDQNQSLTDQNQSLTDQNQSLTDQNQSLIRNAYLHLSDIDQTSKLLGVSREAVLQAISGIPDAEPED